MCVSAQNHIKSACSALIRPELLDIESIYTSAMNLEQKKHLKRILFEWRHLQRWTHSLLTRLTRLVSTSSDFFFREMFTVLILLPPKTKHTSLLFKNNPQQFFGQICSLDPEHWYIHVLITIIQYWTKVNWITDHNRTATVLTLILSIATIVSCSNSFDLDETPSNSVSPPDPSCLTLGHFFHEHWITLKYLEIWSRREIKYTTFLGRIKIKMFCYIENCSA